VPSPADVAAKAATLTGGAVAVAQGS